MQINYWPLMLVASKRASENNLSNASDESGKKSRRGGGRPRNGRRSDRVVQFAISRLYNKDEECEPRRALLQGTPSREGENEESARA